LFSFAERRSGGMADARDLKSRDPRGSCRFESGLRHFSRSARSRRLGTGFGAGRGHFRLEMPTSPVSAEPGDLACPRGGTLRSSRGHSRFLSRRNQAGILGYTFRRSGESEGVDRMKVSTTQIIRAAAITVLAIVTAATAGAGPAPIDNLARYFTGKYRGVTPGNNLMLQINPVSISMSNPYDYFVTI